MTLGVRKIKLMGVAVLAILAIGATGCSSLPSVPDWVDPTTWFGGDDTAADNGTTPDLASVPDKPAAPAADEQHKVTESLAADRANAKYSAEALRGGTEPAAAPPPDVAPGPAADEAPAAPKAKTAAAPAPVQVAAVDRSMTPDPAGSAAPGTLPEPQAGAPVAVAAATPAAPAVTTAALPEPAAAPQAPAKPAIRTTKHTVSTAAVAAPPAVRAPKRTRLAMAEPRSAVAPAAEAAPMARTPVANISPSDAELGFKPSNAPPLDPSVSQFVAEPIVDRYRSTAAQAGLAAAAPSGIASATPSHRIRHLPAKSAVAMGGPEHMEGKVVANLDAIGAGTAAAPSVMANTAGATAVVYFANDGVSLSAEGQAQVRSAVEQYRAAGGQGYVRVVGHSSSRTPNMSAEKHLELIFKKSQDRANSVAHALIQAGVPADRVLVEAVGDTQPVYYESMPKGEDGNRRAEIFVQG